MVEVVEIHYGSEMNMRDYNRLRELEAQHFQLQLAGLKRTDDRIMMDTISRRDIVYERPSPPTQLTEIGELKRLAMDLQKKYENMQDAYSDLQDRHNQLELRVEKLEEDMKDNSTVVQVLAQLRKSGILNDALGN